MLQATKNGKNVASALQVRGNLGKILRRVTARTESLVIEKRGTPQAVLMNCVTMCGWLPEPECSLGEESVRKGSRPCG